MDKPKFKHPVAKVRWQELHQPFEMVYNGQVDKVTLPQMHTVISRNKTGNVALFIMGPEKG